MMNSPSLNNVVFHSCCLWFQGRQEDAEEFLGCVLDGLHEEMVAARQAVAAVGSEMGNKESDVTQHVGEDDGDEWEHVGPKNKSSILRKARLWGGGGCLQLVWGSVKCGCSESACCRNSHCQCVNMAAILFYLLNHD